MCIFWRFLGAQFGPKSPTLRIHVLRCFDRCYICLFCQLIGDFFYGRLHSNFGLQQPVVEYLYRALFQGAGAAYEPIAIRAFHLHIEQAG
jgi:hypothetical protein